MTLQQIERVHRGAIAMGLVGLAVAAVEYVHADRSARAAFASCRARGGAVTVSEIGQRFCTEARR